MTSTEALIQHIQTAFEPVLHPGEDFLQGSYEGCEPRAAIAPFVGQTYWQALEAKTLDAHAEALSFFSEGGLRFFLPAYLVADIRNALQTADPVFTLTSGFSVTEVTIPTGAGGFQKRVGGTVPMNPLRYGAMTAEDYARFRLSVFAREEATAIAAYLQYRYDQNPHDDQAPAIAAALTQFWQNRAATAPTQAELVDHLRREAAFMDALSGHAG